MPEKNKKTVLLLGGRGLIGGLLKDHLADEFRVVASDIAGPDPLPEGFLDIDVRDYDGMLRAIPERVDVMINLAAVRPMPPLVDPREVPAMSAVYVQGAYNVFAAASRCGIPRVIYASSNHVTEGYEVDGESRLERPISSADPPSPASVYGTLKYCGETFGRLFATHHGLSVISLRIGTVSGAEERTLQSEPRATRTLLSQTDTVDLFRAAIETDLHYGVFYGVSDNPGRPWEIAEAIEKLDYRPRENSEDLRKKIPARKKWGFWWGR